MQTRPWGSIIGWCVALGVPMTPWGGTWFGIGLIVIAGALSVWRSWVWLNQQSWHSSAVRWVVMTPAVLLVIVAATWSYYGGLPALRKGEPATFVEITRMNIPNPELFKPEDTTNIDIHFTNKGPSLARDVSFVFLQKINHSSITKRQEDEMFHDLLDNHKGSPESDMTVGFPARRTVQTSKLSKKEADDLRSETTRLYLLGYIHYRDKNGPQKYEFCQWLQPPSVWHLCDGGHNRVISE
ncbi:MAG: hypothetical protein ABI988_19765 [Nitrospirota bacterium]